MSDSNTPVMIEADNLTKLYGATRAIDGVTFNCREGEIVGFLGPNGAGKTTTMRILTGYMPPTAGTATIAGYDTVSHSLDARRRLGYLPETVPLYPEMTVEGYLAFMGRIRRLDNLWGRVDEVLETVSLLDRAESLISKLSKGMRQRLGLAQALLHNPDVLILDEPTIGLDPAQIREVRQLIKDLGQRHTILLSTHILSEVEQICTRAIIVIDGRIRADLPMAQVLDDTQAAAIVLRLAQPAADTLARLRAVPGVLDAQPGDSRDFYLRFDGRDATRTGVAEAAVNAGWGLLELTTERVSLETIFMRELQAAESERGAAVEIDQPAVIESESESETFVPEEENA